jgi:hypothetical protein
MTVVWTFSLALGLTAIINDLLELDMWTDINTDQWSLQYQISVRFVQFILRTTGIMKETLIILGEGYKLWSSSLCSFLQLPVTLALFGPNILHVTVYTKKLICPSHFDNEYGGSMYLRNVGNTVHITTKLTLSKMLRNEVVTKISGWNWLRNASGDGISHLVPSNFWVLLVRLV